MFPSNGIRATIAFPHSPLARVIELTLPPISDMPYRIEFAVDVPEEPALSAALATPTLPLFPGLAVAPDAPTALSGMQARESNR